jgi:hypothetical protein
MNSDGHLETTYGAVAAAADSLDRSRSPRETSSRFCRGRHPTEPPISGSMSVGSRRSLDHPLRPHCWMNSDGHLETTYGAVAAAADSLDRSRSPRETSSDPRFSYRVFAAVGTRPNLLSLAPCPSARVARSIIRSPEHVSPHSREDTRLSRKNSTSYTYVHPVTAAYPSSSRFAPSSLSTFLPTDSQHLQPQPNLDPRWIRPSDLPLLRIECRRVCWERPVSFVAGSSSAENKWAGDIHSEYSDENLPYTNFRLTAGAQPELVQRGLAKFNIIAGVKDSPYPS